MSVLLAGLLAAIPTASASAAPPTPSITLPGSATGLSSSQVEELLSGIPLSDLNPTQLTEVLSGLPGLGSLPANKLQEAITQLITGLTSKGATLAKLLDTGELVPILESELKKLLSLPELLSLLKGENLTTKLTAALGSLDTSQLLDTLLGSAEHPEQLLTELFAALNPATIDTLLGSTLTGGPFSETTVAKLAGELGMTVTELLEELKKTLAELPEDSTALVAPLTDGKLVGVLDGLGGITVSLLNPSSTEGSGGAGGEGGSGGTGEGGAGGSGGGNGGSGGGGSTPSGSSPASQSAPTVVVNLPAAQPVASPSPVATSASASVAKKVGKIKILSHHVKGKTVTLVVQVPAAGKVSLGGGSVRSVHREAAKAERVTLRTVLTKAGAASQRRHRHGLRVKLKASFKIAGGSSSSAPVTVTFA